MIDSLAKNDPMMQKLQRLGGWDLAHFVANAFLADDKKEIPFTELRLKTLMAFSEVYGLDETTPKFESLAEILKEGGVIRYTGELSSLTPIEMTDFGRNYFLQYQR